MVVDGGVVDVRARWGACCLVAAGLAAAALGILGASGGWGAGPSVSLEPGTANVSVGQSVEVRVDGSDVVDLGAYEFAVAYDPAIVSLEAVNDGSFLGSTGRHPVCRDESTVGEVSYVCNTSGLTPQGPSGSGTLAVMRFKGLAQGTTALVFTKLGLAVSEGSSIEIADFQESSLGVVPAGSGGGTSGGSLARPTKVPGALTPTAVPNAPTPMPADGGLNDPGADATHSTPLAGISRPGVAIEDAQEGAGQVAGSGFPVAGTGSQQEAGLPWVSALGLLVASGSTLVLLGSALKALARGAR